MVANPWPGPATATATSALGRSPARRRLGAASAFLQRSTQRVQGSVGLLFARHVTVPTWSLDELITYLAGQAHTPAAATRLRGEFFAEFQHTLTRLGVHLTIT